MFYAANGLHKLLEHNELGDFKYVQSGLINFTISGSGSAKCINLSAKKPRRQMAFRYRQFTIR